ncbi:hypothetical protein HB364_15375 [Pseudoflavitalea sp. X16]|uniref:hypothetical protein n=1 Tax=Paraflavitalea devenefica TaxID=2716334 RepID=UPI00141E4124|nr:hypothetical protein [Paraflavitalea devenefica]NII26469.1 hypothetical protein [Paraflavitalea devenefica]
MHGSFVRTMHTQKNILAIIGSASLHSANQQLVQWLAANTANTLNQRSVPFRHASQFLSRFSGK